MDIIILFSLLLGIATLIIAGVIYLKSNKKIKIVSLFQIYLVIFSLLFLMSNADVNLFISVIILMLAVLLGGLKDIFA